MFPNKKQHEKDILFCTHRVSILVEANWSRKWLVGQDGDDSDWVHSEGVDNYISGHIVVSHEKSQGSPASHMESLQAKKLQGANSNEISMAGVRRS